MNDLLRQIAQVKESEIADVLLTVLRRYGELFPDWEVSTISINKYENRNEQIDQIIQMLEKMK